MTGSPDDILRTFIAVPLVGNAREAALRLQERMRRDISDARLVRWERAPNMHLTIQFLGETARSDVSKVESALAEAVKPHHPFDLALGLPATFGRGQPRVLVVELDQGIDELKALHRDVATHLSPLGFEPDRREYRPHLTLGRVRRGKGKLTMGEARELNERHGSITEGQSMLVEEVVFFQSELTPRGAIHSRLATIKLGSI